MKTKIASFAFAVLFVISFLGVKACINSNNIPDSMKDARKILKQEGYDISIKKKADKIREYLNEGLETEAEGVDILLAATNEKSGDVFFVLHCETTDDARVMVNDFEAFIYEEQLWEYTVKREYTMVYFGHEDLVKHICGD